MKVAVFDLETTGFPVDGKKTGIMQIGWTNVSTRPDGQWIVDARTEEFLCNPFYAAPDLELEIEALSIHHITREMVTDPDADNVRYPDVALRIMRETDPDAFACHNLEHDGHYFTGGGKPMICTLKAARAIWPDLPKHSNQYLRYALKLDVDPDRANRVHGAGPDSYVTACLLQRMFDEGATLDDLITFSNQPTLLRTMPFGKNKGKAFEDISTSDLKWVRNLSDLRKDLRSTLDYHLEKRGEL